ncbi:hypothetical protein [Caballeronia sp. GAFFF1]|uniref:hypothetical protein n=1 Tax=Caballeronia sp. GAFFF1 TaxID=2921779 RepID=UPI0020291A4E|nr:hypothetical protein [Caballeronia sp. GAFFF1]
MKRPSPRQVFVTFIGNFVLALGVLLAASNVLRDSCSGCAAPQRALIVIAAATCIVVARPAFRTERGRASRSMFASEPDIDALFIGRLMGLALGVMTSLWLSVSFR